MSSFHCKEFICDEIRQLPLINGQQHFSDIIKFLQECESTLEKITNKFGIDLRNERYFVEYIMKLCLCVKLYVDVDKKLHNKTFVEFERCLLDSFKEIIEDKTDERPLLKLSDIIYNYQMVADELNLYFKYNPKSGWYNTEEDKETIRVRFVRKFFNVYKLVLLENDIFYSGWKHADFSGIRLFLLMKNL